jgi:2-polyprenyl-6-methoxyphenol hydroxylase-like FAD-dependent oxidoreductase
MVELKDQYYGDWDEKLQDLITKADEDTLVPRTMYMLPIGFSWPHRKGVTVIGDAAHLMTPFAGEGVNLAMWDAMLLGQTLVGTLKDGWDKDKVWTAMRVFEEEMFTRAREKAQETWDNMQMMVQPGAAKAMVAMFEMMAQGGPPGPP